MGGAEIEGMEAALQRGVTTQLAQSAAGLRVDGLVVHEKVLFGFPEQAIPEFARTDGTDLILMGAHGRRPVARLLLGSVAERTMLEAPCPVLVVREGDLPFAAWGAGERPLRVMVGVDNSPSADGAVDWVRHLRQVAPCDVVLVHHYWPPREYARLGLHGPRDLFETDPEVAALLERDLRRRVGDLPGTGAFVLRVRAGWGRPGEALAEQAASEKADLLIVGTHQPHGWERLRRGSVAVAALRTAQIPLLCVPAASRPADEPPAKAHIPQLRTVLHACALLRGAGGVVHLTHVRERHLPSPIYAYESGQDALTPELQAEIEGRLRALIPAEAATFGIEVRVTVVDGGAPAEAILQTARRQAADAICVASHGRSGLLRSVLGSVAEAVISGSELPVHVVRPGSGA
jgi:nucleotide-binding universal stress UspA family protein